MAIISFKTDPQHDALLLAMTREMMGDPEATAQEAIAFWAKRGRDSLKFFAIKYYRAQQVAELDDAPDITVE